MTREELQKAIILTKANIDKVKQQIKHSTVPQEKRQLLLKKRELQYLQLWHLEQLKRID